MLFQFLSRHICRIVVVEMMIYAGDVLYVIEHFGYIMAYDDNGALPVDLFQHLVHLLLETAVDVGVGLIQYHYIGFRNNGAGEEYSLQLSAAQGCDMAVFQLRELHLFQTVEYLLVLCLGVSGKEALGLAEAGEYHFIDGDRELFVEMIVLGQISHADFPYFLSVFIKADAAVCGFQQSQNKAHEGCLATTVGTDDAKIIVFVDGEVDIVEHLLAFIACRKILDFYDWSHIIVVFTSQQRFSCLVPLLPLPASPSSSLPAMD